MSMSELRVEKMAFVTRMLTGPSCFSAASNIRRHSPRFETSAFDSTTRRPNFRMSSARASAGVGSPMKLMHTSAPA